MQVKKMNEEMVRQALKLMKQGTKLMVSKATGLSVATCGTLLNELLMKGEITELGLEESSGGRPATVFRYNENFAYIACIIIGVGVGSHSLTFKIVNLLGETIEEGYKEHKQVEPKVIYELVDELIAQFPQINAIGIGVPGAVKQGVINVSEIKEIIDVPFEAVISEKHGIEVIMDNDMNLTAYGFYQKQDYEEEVSIAVASFIEGAFPGSGMMIDGHIHRGSTSFAGEIAFLPFGMTQEDQFRQLHDRETFHLIAGHAVASLIAIINPETIALTGGLVKPNDLDLITQECLKYIPEMHMPHLTILEHPEDDYMHGLVTMTLQSLAYSLYLVEMKR